MESLTTGPELENSLGQIRKWKRTGQVVADVCSPSYRFVWQIDRTYAVASQIS